MGKCYLANITLGMPSIEVNNPDLFKPEDCSGTFFEKFCVGKFKTGVFSVSVILLTAGTDNFLLGKDG